MGAAPVCRPLELRPARVGPPCSHHLSPAGQAGRSAGARFVAVCVCLCSHCLGFVLCFFFVLFFSVLLTPGGAWLRGYERCLVMEVFAWPRMVPDLAGI